MELSSCLGEYLSQQDKNIYCTTFQKEFYPHLVSKCKTLFLISDGGAEKQVVRRFFLSLEVARLTGQIDFLWYLLITFCHLEKLSHNVAKLSDKAFPLKTVPGTAAGNDL